MGVEASKSKIGCSIPNKPYYFFPIGDLLAARYSVANKVTFELDDSVVRRVGDLVVGAFRVNQRGDASGTVVWQSASTHPPHMSSVVIEQYGVTHRSQQRHLVESL